MAGLHKAATSDIYGNCRLCFMQGAISAAQIVKIAALRCFPGIDVYELTERLTSAFWRQTDAL